MEKFKNLAGKDTSLTPALVFLTLLALLRYA